MISLNSEFIHELKLSVGTYYWDFDETEPTNIVPNELTHEYLLQQFTIDYNILKYYCSSARSLISDIEFAQLKAHGWIHGIETTLLPYSNVIFGAYHSRSDLVFKLNWIVESSKTYHVNEKEVKQLSDLIPYFKDYAIGFKTGFNDFEKTQITPFLTPFASQQDYVNKVFEYLTTKKQFLWSGWDKFRKGFAFQSVIEPDTGNFLFNTIVEGIEDGQTQGFLYRAWSIVLANNSLFAPLFEKLLQPLTPQPTNDKADTEKYTAKHHVLAYLFECNAKGESLPVGNKKELERVGDKRMGAGKGNRFYKVFNEVISLDLNAEKNLFKIGGEYWRKAVIELSKAPELVEKYLQSKQL